MDEPSWIIDDLAGPGPVFLPAWLPRPPVPARISGWCQEGDCLAKASQYQLLATRAAGAGLATQADVYVKMSFFFNVRNSLEKSPEKSHKFITSRQLQIVYERFN